MPTRPTISFSGSVTWKANSPCTMVSTGTPLLGSSTCPMRPPNFTPVCSRTLTKKTSAMNRLPPVKLSTRLDRKGRLALSSVCRPGPRVSTTLPSRKNTARSSASTVSCDFIGIVGSGCFQTTCGFASSGRAMTISPTPRLNQSITPMGLSFRFERRADYDRPSRVGRKDSRMSEQRTSDAGEAGRAPAGEPAPETAEESAEEVGKPDFRCPSCGAATTWDPASDALACDYCGARTSVPRADGEVRERPLADAGSGGPRPGPRAARPALRRMRRDGRPGPGRHGGRTASSAAPRTSCHRPPTATCCAPSR